MTMAFSILSLIGSMLVFAAALAGFGANATNMSIALIDTGSRSRAGGISFHSDVSNAIAIAKKTNIAVGSYPLSNGDWAYCLSLHQCAECSFQLHAGDPGQLLWHGWR